MLLLVPTIKDQHILRTDGTLTTKLIFEEVKYVLWFSTHGFSLFSKVDPGWSCGSPCAFGFNQLERCWTSWYTLAMHLFGDFAKHKFVCVCFMTTHIIQVNAIFFFFLIILSLFFCLFYYFFHFRFFYPYFLFNRLYQFFIAEVDNQIITILQFFL